MIIMKNLDENIFPQSSTFVNIFFILVKKQYILSYQYTIHSKRN
jgi:hypothetical protein